MLLKYYQKLDDAISFLFSSVCNENKLLKEFFKNKKIVYVDIGTNEGNYLDYIKKNFNIKKIVCFEPITHLSNKLKNKYSAENIEVNNYALSNNVSEKNFYEYKISSQSSLYKQNDLFKSLKDLRKITKVKTFIFDKKFNKGLKIDLCKIDVQGEELNVLKGMMSNLKKKNIKLIKIEISFLERYLGIKSNFYDIINFLNKFNYQLISISKIKFKNNKILLMDAYFQVK